jgi:GH15 family glucan-1,4-alpha-glucosidase
VRRREDGLEAIGGASALHLRTPVELRGQDFTTVAEFTVEAGQRVPFTLTWHPSYETAPPASDPEASLRETEAWWRDWSARCTYQGPWREPVVRSLITLKALTYAPSGGLVASVTTSLPEQLGGVRNWDYRYCWLRDATFALYALMTGGYVEEAQAWQEWLVRAVAGRPDHAQILYGVTGDRLLPEWELPWLPGYARSTPVRVGNAASGQFQLDVYGEVADALHCAWRMGLTPDENAWRVGRAMVEYVESAWQEPDEGIWEVRGPRRPFTHSRIMAWVALDRAVKAVERFGRAGPVDRWRQLRDVIHADVCRQGYDPDLRAFVQSYGSKLLDASLLMIPLVGFLPATDPRVLGTVRAIQQHLVTDGFVARYQTRTDVDGLPPGEGVFLPCTFWLADNLALQGRRPRRASCSDATRGAQRRGARGSTIRPRAGSWELPQAFTHMGLVNTAEPDERRRAGRASLTADRSVGGVRPSTRSARRARVDAPDYRCGRGAGRPRPDDDADGEDGHQRRRREQLRRALRWQGSLAGNPCRGSPNISTTEPQQAEDVPGRIPATTAGRCRQDDLPVELPRRRALARATRAAPGRCRAPH